VSGKGRTIRYLGGGVGQIPIKIQKKNIVQNKVLKKKIEQEFEVIFKIIMPPRRRKFF
jgi:hypothetical protein